MCLVALSAYVCLARARNERAGRCGGVFRSGHWRFVCGGLVSSEGGVRKDH